jgi:hypothetical protein
MGKNGIKKAGPCLTLPLMLHGLSPKADFKMLKWVF